MDVITYPSKLIHISIKWAEEYSNVMDSPNDFI